MPIKKLELDNLHPANPLKEVVKNINDNLDAITEIINNLNGGIAVMGEQGPKGDPGIDGREGPTGPQGERGTPGERGDQGVPGRDGVNGQDGAPGKDGATGLQGEQGIPGKDGLPGPQGIPGLQGPKGETGAQGVQGLPGPQGIQGLKGDTGATGPAGAKGDIGAQGIQGVAGPVGAQGPAGVGILGFTSGYVNAGAFVTLDNIKATVTTSGSRGISVAAVSGSFTASIAGHYMYSYASAEGTATAYPGHTTTVTPSGSWFNWSFGNAGDTSIFYVNDYNNKRFYRITVMIGAGYANNFISIERLY